MSSCVNERLAALQSDHAIQRDLTTAAHLLSRSGLIALSSDVGRTAADRRKLADQSRLSLLLAVAHAAQHAPADATMRIIRDIATRSPRTIADRLEMVGLIDSAE